MWLFLLFAGFPFIKLIFEQLSYFHCYLLLPLGAVKDKIGCSDVVKSVQKGNQAL